MRGAHLGLVAVLGACGTLRAPAPQPSNPPAPPAPAVPAHPENDALRYPLPGPAACSRGFSARDRHFGLDLPAPTGTPVLSSAAGVVVRASRHRDYGLVAVVQHTSDGRYAIYAHLAELAVALGDLVDAGTRIGVVGATGNASRPHLHWEILEAPAPLPVRAEGPLGIPGGAYRIDPAAVATTPCPPQDRAQNDQP